MSTIRLCDNFKAPTREQIVEWESRQHRACILCKWGEDERILETPLQNVVTLSSDGNAQQRMCVNPAVVGSRPGARVEVRFARMRARDSTVFDDSEHRPILTAQQIYSQGACGPDAKYLDFPGLNK